MGRKIVTLSNGNVIEYKIVKGTAYHVATPEVVVNLLEHARGNGLIVKIVYGDVKSGKPWGDHPEIGTVGRSMGEIKIPLVVPANDIGGPAILSDSIVDLYFKNEDGKFKKVYTARK